MLSDRRGQREPGGAGRQRAIVGPVAVRSGTLEVAQQKPKVVRTGVCRPSARSGRPSVIKDESSLVRPRPAGRRAGGIPPRFIRDSRAWLQPASSWEERRSPHLSVRDVWLLSNSPTCPPRRAPRGSCSSAPVGRSRPPYPAAAWSDPADTSLHPSVYSVLMFWACVLGVVPGPLFEGPGDRSLEVSEEGWVPPMAA